MTVVQYFHDHSPWISRKILAPTWLMVETAIRQMDNDCFPIVQLNHTEFDDDDNIFNLIGGDGQFALFQMTGPWQYDNPKGGDMEVRLWKSDQGYFCKQRNILYDVEKVLRITKQFYETGSYENLNEIE
jgi:hypothetical protein